MGLAHGERKHGRRRLRLLPIALVAYSVARPVHAGGPCDSSRESWVRVTFADDGWSPALQEAILLDLRAGLSRHQIEVCGPTEQTTRPPTAVLRLSATGLDAVQVTVELRDAVTQKELTRNVDLTLVPSDGRALAIALAADELLWASWAEIALRRSNRKTRAPPQLVAEVARSIQPAASTGSRQVPVRLGLQLSAERYARGLTQFGPDAAFWFNGSASYGARLSAGYRQGLDVTSPNGRVTSSAVLASADLTAALLHSSRLELTWTIGGTMAWCHFEGHAKDSKLDGELNGLALYAQTRLLAAWHLQGPLWLQVAVGAGLPLQGLEATDAGQVVVGMSGFQQSVLAAILGKL